MAGSMGLNGYFRFSTWLLRRKIRRGKPRSLFPSFRSGACLILTALRMPQIPLEDNYVDVISKAQNGLRMPDADLARRSGVPVEALQRVKSGEVLDDVLAKVAAGLTL